MRIDPNDYPKPARPPSLRAAGWAGLLSLMVPGLGQIYGGAFWIGTALLGANFLLLTALSALSRYSAPTGQATAVAAVLMAVIPPFHLVSGIHAALMCWRNRPAKRRGWFRPTIAAALAAVALSAVTSALIPIGWRSLYAASASMMPNLLPQETFLVDIRPGSAPPDRGDVIAFALPAQPGTIYVKRVIGLPGDTVAIRDGRLVLNGQVAARRADPAGPDRFIETIPYGASFAILATGQQIELNTMPPAQVPAGYLFVLGDNRDNSLDSRSLGFIRAADVVGRAHTIIWSSVWDRIGGRVE